MLIRGCVVLSSLMFALPGAAAPDLTREGVFGFPQNQAKVLCDTPELRVSMVSDSEYLYVQAVVFADDDDGLGETRDGRAIGDRSSLAFDVEASGELNAERDRTYSLSPWPTRPGLHYSVLLGPARSTTLRADSEGRGAIEYVDSADGSRVRIDSFLIPFAELERKEGEKVHFAYLAASPSPELTLNSVGFERNGGYTVRALPREMWHEVVLGETGAVDAIDVQAVPEGRGTVERPARKPEPEIGTVPPPVEADVWLNWQDDHEPTLEGLRGKVVVVEFWATWCGPCVAGIPHLNEIHERYAEDGLVLLALTNQSARHIEEFVEGRTMNYTVGAGSETIGEYGVRGIPRAFVIGRDGKLAWAGNPNSEAFEREIVKALGE